MLRFPTRRRLSGVVFLALAGMTATTSSAAAADGVTGAVTVTRSGTTLTVIGTPTADVIDVSFTKGTSTFQGTWVVVGSTTTLSAGQGCTANSTTQVSCSGNGLGDRVSIDAGAGDDRVTYRFGLPSVIDGGDGQDTIVGGFGPDTIFASGLGNGVGTDRVDGGDGPDHIQGGGGNDILDGGRGDDIVSGEGSDDTITGGLGNDKLSGSKGDDIVRGGPGADQMSGASGSDSLIGDEGVDSADGGPLSGSDSGIDTCDAETEIRCEK